MKRLKRLGTVLLVFLIITALTGCESNKEGPGTMPDPNRKILEIFACKESVGALSPAVNAYASYDADIDIKVHYDDADMLAGKIEAGYLCDIYITSDLSTLDWLDGEAGPKENPNGNDLILKDSRREVFIKISEDGDDIPFTAAVIKTGKYPEKAESFIEFLTKADYDGADEAYEDYGFKKPE